MTDEDKINQLLEEVPACEMATIGYFGQKTGDAQKKTGFKVITTSDGYPQSHIHLIGKGKSVCIKLTKNEYFKHKGYPDSLSQEEAREFNTFLTLPYKYPQVFEMGDVKFKVETYWQYAIYQWKLENDGFKDDLKLEVDADGYVIYPEQPDYTLLNDVHIEV